jgi:hypothetical protein
VNARVAEANGASIVEIVLTPTLLDRIANAFGSLTSL